MSAHDEDRPGAVRLGDHVVRATRALLGPELEQERGAARAQRSCHRGFDRGHGDGRRVRVAERGVDRAGHRVEHDQRDRSRVGRVLRLLGDEAHPSAGHGDPSPRAVEVVGGAAVACGERDSSAEASRGRRRRVVDRLDPDRTASGRELLRALDSFAIGDERKRAHFRLVAGGRESSSHVGDRRRIARASRDARPAVVVRDALQGGEMRP